MGSFSEKRTQELSNEHPPTSANTNNTLRNPISFLPPSSQACRLIKILKPKNKASRLNPSNPTLYLTREAHQPWQWMGHNSQKERASACIPGWWGTPISNTQWGYRLGFMLMNGINFSEKHMRLLWSIKEHKEIVVQIYIKNQYSLWQEKRTLHTVYHLPRECVIYNPEESVCGSSSLSFPQTPLARTWHS